MGFQTAIVRLQPVPGQSWTFKSSKPIIRVFDECERGLIPVSHIKVGSMQARLANCPAGQVWGEIIETEQV
jgi:hypothetical protein